MYACGYCTRCIGSQLSTVQTSSQFGSYAPPGTPPANNAPASQSSHKLSSVHGRLSVCPSLSSQSSQRERLPARYRTNCFEESVSPRSRFGMVYETTFDRPRSRRARRRHDSCKMLSLHLRRPRDHHQCLKHHPLYYY